MGIPFSELKCGDYFAMYVHDEDSHYGLWVENERAEGWRCYGDKRAYNPEDKRNREICEEAIKTSVQEIYDAYQNKNGTPVFGALKLVPNLEKACDWSTNPENRVLFRFEGNRLFERKDLNNLSDHNYDECLIGPTTAADLKARYNPPGWNN